MAPTQRFVGLHGARQGLGQRHGEAHAERQQQRYNKKKRGKRHGPGLGRAGLHGWAEQGWRRWASRGLGWAWRVGPQEVEAARGSKAGGAGGFVGKKKGRGREDALPAVSSRGRGAGDRRSLAAWWRSRSDGACGTQEAHRWGAAGKGAR
ncbi:hypothetical protein BRADI_4g17376v3, partial [Brachypodium distachyon]